MKDLEKEMALNPEVTDSLRKLGLNQYEAKAYHALAVFGDHTAGQLSETAELPRPRVYDVLARLQDKGFVAIQQGRPVRYSALPIFEAVKTLKKQRHRSLVGELAQMEVLGKGLQSKLKQVAPHERGTGAENVWTLKGRDAIYSKMASMLSKAKKHVLLSSSADGLKRKTRTHGKALEKARARGVKINFVSPEALRGDAARIAHKLHVKEIPTRMLLADDQALLFLTGHGASADEEIGLWVKSPHLAETLKKVV